MKFTTETGSEYELDMPGKRMRRLSGTHEPTRNQGTDGEWRSFEDIGGLGPAGDIVPIAPGVRVLVIWGVEGTSLHDMVLRRTLISEVTEVTSP